MFVRCEHYRLYCWFVFHPSVAFSTWYHPSIKSAAVASIDWGCAVQVAAAGSIGTNQSWVATNAQTLYASHIIKCLTPFRRSPAASGIYTGIVLSHAMICCLATRILARLQTIYVVLNILCAYFSSMSILSAYSPNATAYVLQSSLRFPSLHPQNIKTPQNSL
jgi:hypothetical protein